MQTYENRQKCNNNILGEDKNMETDEMTTQTIDQLKAQYEETWKIENNRERNIIQAQIRDRIAQLGGEI